MAKKATVRRKRKAGGRPALGTKGGTSPELHVRLPQEEMDALDARAAALSLTRSAAARQILRDALGEG